MLVDTEATGWRLWRAVGFVLTAAVVGVLGHLMSAGSAVPVPAVLTATTGAALGAWWLSAAERSPLTLGVGVLAVQAGLHLLLTVAVTPSSAAAMGPMDVRLMVAAHVVAALLGGLWLHVGDRALFSAAGVCRSVRRVVAVAALRPGGPTVAPPVPVRRAPAPVTDGRPLPPLAGDWLPRAVGRRGPPAVVRAA